MTAPVPAPGLGADAVVADAVAAGLEAVEQRLRDVVHSSHPLLTEAATHLVQAGGKRFRPMLALLAGHLGDPSAPEVVEAAVVVELTHLATLYHDDVMDEAAVRRGAASANTRWTNTVAILTGDYLFARASDLVAELGPDAVRIQARTFARLVEGQIAETAGPGAGEDPVSHHLRVIADKTGSLIATSARLGAMLAGADPADVETVARFGEVVGTAFQLSDDLIDVLSDSAESGKTPGTDLREGIRTLPVLLALQGPEPAPGTDAARLRELLTGDLSDDDRLAEALGLLRTSPAVAEAQARLAASVAEARDVAAALPAGPARDALVAVTGLVQQRTG
ncbi:MAG TPA: polyprenyl synthetase family protein [Mycobacteriales bacterium]|nr:polyprenyl synthetase family protein [Mycobacteriales bacterium]